MPYKQPSVNQKRPYDARWQRLRAQRLKEEPLCRMCLTTGRSVPANVVDHIIPIKDGGTNQTENLMPLCFRCHNSIKTPADVAQRKRVERSLVSLRAVWLGYDLANSVDCVDYRAVRKMFLPLVSAKTAHTFTQSSIDGLLIARANGELPPCELTIIFDDANWMKLQSEKYKLPIKIDEPSDSIGLSHSSQAELDYLRDRMGIEFLVRKELQNAHSCIIDL